MNLKKWVQAGGRIFQTYDKETGGYEREKVIPVSMLLHELEKEIYSHKIPMPESVLYNLMKELREIQKGDKP